MVRQLFTLQHPLLLVEGKSERRLGGRCRRCATGSHVLGVAQICNLSVSVEMVAGRADFLGARNLFRRNVRFDHALDNSATLFADQHSCGLKSALLWLRRWRRQRPRRRRGGRTWRRMQFCHTAQRGEAAIKGARRLRRFNARSSTGCETRRGLGEFKR